MRVLEIVDNGPGGARSKRLALAAKTGERGHVKLLEQGATRVFQAKVPLLIGSQVCECADQRLLAFNNQQLGQLQAFQFFVHLAPDALASGHLVAIVIINRSTPEVGHERRHDQLSVVEDQRFDRPAAAADFNPLCATLRAIR